MQSRRPEKLHYSSTRQKKAGISTLTSDKVAKNITRNKEGYFIIINSLRAHKNY